MQSTKLVNRILLSSVAFSVSFGIGLLANRDLKKALLTGVITFPASYVGAVVADKRRITQEKLLRGSLQNQIQALGEEETRLYQSLSTATATRQDIEVSINALQAERSQLLNRVSELHNQKRQLYQELGGFQQQKQQQEAELHSLKTQLQQLERQQAQQNQSISARTVKIQQTETRLNYLQAELEQLQIQISEKQNQKEQLNQDLATLEHQKQDLGGEIYDLQTQIRVLGQRQEQLNQTLLPLQQQQEFEVSITAKQAEFEQLQGRILEHQNQQEALSLDLVTLESQKQQLEVDYHNLQTQIQELEKQKTLLSSTSTHTLESELSEFLPEEWCEWLEFARQLDDDEQIALKAILEQDEAALKKIANEKSTMPQVLIDSLNEGAFGVVGDNLLIGGGSSVIPEFYEEYAPIFLEPFTVYFKDLLPAKEKSAEKPVLLKLKRWCCIHTLEHSANSLIISTDGKMLISGGKEGKIKLWGLETGELLNTCSDNSSSVKSLTISPNNAIIASGSGDSKVRLWESNTGKLLHIFSGHSSLVSSVAISPDGKILASGSYDKNIRLWNVKTQKFIRALYKTDNFVISLTFSPELNRKELIAGLDNGKILQFDLEKNSPPEMLLWSKTKVEAVALSSDSQKIIVGDRDGNIVYHSTWSTNFIKSQQGSVLSVAMSPDDKTFLSAGNDIRLWNLDSVELVELLEIFKEHSNQVDCVAFSPSGESFVSSSQDGTIKIWQYK